MPTNIDLDQPIRLDYNEMSSADFIDFKRETGISLQDFINQLEQRDGDDNWFFDNLANVCAMLWLFYRKRHPGLTLAEVQALPMMKLFSNFEVSSQAPPSVPTDAARVRHPNISGQKDPAFDAAVQAAVREQMAQESKIPS